MSLFNRRQFLLSSSALSMTNMASAPWTVARAEAGISDKLVVMVYLKGGNDAYNTLVPFTNMRYYKMRPNIAQKREQLIPLTETQGLHKSLAALTPLWRDHQLAILQGIGQEEITNQHYRDAETLFTGAGADQFLVDGWMTRALVTNSSRLKPAVDVMAFGDLDIRESDPMGPFRGNKLGVINVVYPNEWLTRHKIAETAYLTTTKSTHAANTFALTNAPLLKTNFPADSFGQALQATVELAAAGMAPPVVHITLNAEDGDQHNAFDTHWDQQTNHGAVLARLGYGLAAFRQGMQEIGQWDNTLLFTYDEFGRSPKENEKQGTHHGWAGVHFVIGGKVKGGLHGEPMPVVDVFQIDGPPPTTDYRALYTTVIEQWWGGHANGVFQKRFKSIDLLRT
ncbi:MAG: DUF1501 domain-containing protein [Pseudomonadota bacterium]